jgi:hypothetical protein
LSSDGRPPTAPDSSCRASYERPAHFRAFKNGVELGGHEMHIAYTDAAGIDSEEDVARALRAGFDRHIAKPATLDAIQRALAGVDHHNARSQRAI